MYCVDETADEPIMLINKHIGYDEADGVGILGALFQEELLRLDRLGKNRIQVWINSPGGSVSEGYAIYNAILKSKTKVDTYCVGIAASMAAVIFQAGRTRYMADYGILMYHNPFGSDNSKLIDAMKSSIVTMIAQRCEMDEAAVAKMMDRTSFILADEAERMKLTDKIEVSADFNRKKMMPVVSNDSREFWTESNKVLNTIFTKTTNMSLIKVTNKLKLNDAANEDAIVTAIESIENRVNIAETALAAANGTIKEANEAKAKLEAEIKEAKDKLAIIEQKEKEAAQALKVTNAKNLVAGFVKTGKIKNDAGVIKTWEEKAVADHDGTKSLLESIPNNQQSAKILEISGVANNGANAIDKLANAVALEMADINNRLK